MAFRSTKTYGHELGFSCAFRQWRANNSHCRFLHGYALSIKLEFTGDLDERNWVMDFGGLRAVKLMLERTFDHTTIVAEDDPLFAEFVRLDNLGVINMVTMPHVGCERFAEWIGNWVTTWLAKYKPDLTLLSVEVREHGANSAIWLKDPE